MSFGASVHETSRPTMRHAGVSEADYEAIKSAFVYDGLYYKAAEQASSTARGVRLRCATKSVTWQDCLEAVMKGEDEATIGKGIRSTFVCSVFTLTNRAGYLAPGFNIRFDEKGTGNSTFITGGGTRLYITRVGSCLNQSTDAQAADSHFVADRVISALFISGAGLFRASPMGRIFVEAAVETLRWDSQVDLEPYYSERVRAVHDAFDRDEFGSWFGFICENTPVRRALHDAVQAINNPVEAFVYIYRGFEWLKQGLKLSWDDIYCCVRTHRPWLSHCLSFKHCGAKGSVRTVLV